MIKFRRLLAVWSLIVFTFGIAMAGDTLTPPDAPPPPAGQFAPDDSTTVASTAASSQAPATQYSTLDITTTSEMLAAWLLSPIL